LLLPALRCLPNHHWSSALPTLAWPLLKSVHGALISRVKGQM
jgi:hypothetical protein